MHRVDIAHAKRGLTAVAALRAEIFRTVTKGLVAAYPCHITALSSTRLLCHQCPAFHPDATPSSGCSHWFTANRIIGSSARKDGHERAVLEAEIRLLFLLTTALFANCSQPRTWDRPGYRSIADMALMAAVTLPKRILRPIIGCTTTPSQERQRFHRRSPLSFA